MATAFREGFLPGGRLVLDRNVCVVGIQFNPDIVAQESRLQPDQAFPAGCPVPAGIPPAKAGTPVRHISELFFQIS